MQEEAQKTYPDGWNDEEKADFQEWVDRHADTLTKESQSESQSGVAANEEPEDPNRPRPHEGNDVR